MVAGVLWKQGKHHAEHGSARRGRRAFRERFHGDARLLAEPGDFHDRAMGDTDGGHRLSRAQRGARGHWLGARDSHLAESSSAKRLGHRAYRQMASRSDAAQYSHKNGL